jgi:hypothetical protein
VEKEKRAPQSPLSPPTLLRRRKADSSHIFRCLSPLGLLSFRLVWSGVRVRCTLLLFSSSGESQNMHGTLSTPNNLILLTVCEKNCRFFSRLSRTCKFSAFLINIYALYVSSLIDIFKTAILELENRNKHSHITRFLFNDYGALCLLN